MKFLFRGATICQIICKDFACVHRKGIIFIFTLHMQVTAKAYFLIIPMKILAGFLKKKNQSLSSL